uniref:Uncharacterized protein n=1 Tax=Siphoviridae sp. ct3R43 TaxID=2825321 RepID=A0A8S5VFT4_9CAUD|nr:MAG TPA: hypothetical protein [Siphoviridae sp. ct3R43]DAU38548.1 MAG TPA: hypothetical protein [Caudoviricetes sp.]
MCLLFRDRFTRSGERLRYLLAALPFREQSCCGRSPNTESALSQR